MAEGVLVLPQLHVPELTFLSAMDASERLSGSHALACTSDTSSGPVPTLTADAVNSLTIVPVSNLNSVSSRSCMSRSSRGCLSRGPADQRGGSNDAGWAPPPQRRAQASCPCCLFTCVWLRRQASLAAAAAVAAERGPCGAASPSQQHNQLEALRDRRRLLFTQAPTDCTPDVVKTWLGQFGTVEQLQMCGENGAVVGSKCGLVTMGTSESAAAAVAAVLGNMQLPSAFQKLSLNYVVQLDDAALSADGHAMPTSLAASADRTVRQHTLPTRKIDSQPLKTGRPARFRLQSAHSYLQAAAGRTDLHGGSWHGGMCWRSLG